MLKRLPKPDCQQAKKDPKQVASLFTFTKTGMNKTDISTGTSHYTQYSLPELWKHRYTAEDWANLDIV